MKPTLAAALAAASIAGIGIVAHSLEMPSTTAQKPRVCERRVHVLPAPAPTPTPEPLPPPPPVEPDPIDPDPQILPAPSD